MTVRMMLKLQSLDTIVAPISKRDDPRQWGREIVRKAIRAANF